MVVTGHTAVALADLFPPGVAVVEATPEMYEEPLAPQEEPAVARAAEGRRRAFRAGRACARRALAEMGRPDAAIPVRAGGRRPVWPDGFTGSITHCEGFAAAVAAPLAVLGGVGIDAEARGRVSERALRAICTDAELARLEELGDVREWGTLVFSAKEAGFKCLGPLTGVWIGFRDAEVDFAPGAAEITTRVVAGPLAGLSLRGAHALGEDVLVTSAHLSPAEAGAIRCAC